MIREIVKIDEELCNGCGLCVPNCHEGALQIIDGKARLVSELMCDGLGACIGHCPEGAITIEEREADAYDEVATISQMIKSGKNTVFAHLKHLQDHNETGYLTEALTFIRANRDAMPFEISEVHEWLHSPKATENGGSGSCSTGSCPGTASQAFTASGLTLATPVQKMPSALSHWPVQLHLINPAASHFHGADLLVAADCAGFTYGNFHNDFIKDRKVIIGCPKLDHGTDSYIQKLVQLIDHSKVNTITLVIMEVPCCSGLSRMVQMATEMASRKVPVKEIMISIKGEILSEEWI